MSKFYLTLIGLLYLAGNNANAQDTVSINSSTHYQIIEGWGHGGGILGFLDGAEYMLDSSVANPANYEKLDYITDDLGLTGSRTWEVGPRTDGTGIDSGGDCDALNWSKFQSNTLSWQDAQYLVYFKNRVIAEGYTPSFYSSPGYPTHATDLKPWIMYHPGERALQLWANALYLKNTYGLTINYAVIYNEPSSPITSAILADDIKALGPRFTSHGLSTMSQFAEAVAPQNDWNFITPVDSDAALWPYVGRLSYHNYGTADPYRTYIRDFGLFKGIRRAQTEMGNPTFDDLYSDLTLGGVSYWEVAYAGPNTLVPSNGLTSFTPSSTYFRLRELMHYVRPGAIRIDAIPNDNMLSVLSFLQGSAITTIIENKNAGTKTVHLSGLPAGTYGLSRAVSSGTSFTELGVQTVGAGGTLDISVNGGSAVTTLYPKTIANMPPTIMTWGTNPGYLVSPAATTTLSVTASDPELATLTYQWTLISNPAGATPLIASPSAASTSVSGLSVAGTYVFNVSVSDGTNTVSKKVYICAYSSTPQPVLGSAGFRINTPYGLVFDNPGDTTHAIIELPTSSVTLQVGISDLANSNFSGAGTWSLVSQPIAANAIVGATTYIFVSIRANVTGMTVPGDYIFDVSVNNPGHPNLTARIICTVKPASAAPVISSITPFADTITLPVSSDLITAITYDANSDTLRHWWEIKAVPAGAYPVFDHQGRRIATASNLIIPGTYTFTLRAFNDLYMTTKDVTIVVKPDPNAGVQNTRSGNEHLVIYPNPNDGSFILSASLHGKASIEVVNNTGQLIYKDMVESNGEMNKKIVLDKNIPVGLYLLRVISNETSNTKQFTIAR